MLPGSGREASVDTGSAGGSVVGVGAGADATGYDVVGVTGLE